MATNPKTLDPVHPNAGIEAAYRKQLDKLVDEMHRSILYWVKASYRANTPEMALDISPAAAMQAIMKRLTRYWLKRFNAAAPKLADYFATSVSKRSDSALKQILRESGMSVQFKATKAFNDVSSATINANVSLIKSIAQQHLQNVEGIVMRSVQEGRDLGTLSKEIQARYALSRKRAALIARDQNNKATAALTRVRHQELGVTQAVWMHSHGGADPRSEHVRWGKEKKVYDIDKGMYSEVDKQYVWPGTPIGCRCVGKPIIPGLPVR